MLLLSKQSRGLPKSPAIYVCWCRACKALASSMRVWQQKPHIKTRSIPVPVVAGKNTSDALHQAFVLLIHKRSVKLFVMLKYYSSQYTNNHSSFSTFKRRKSNGVTKDIWRSLPISVSSSWQSFLKHVCFKDIFFGLKAFLTADCKQLFITMHITSEKLTYCSLNIKSTLFL